VLVVLAAFLLSCDRREPTAYTSLDSSLSPLADAFNAQAGNVRVLMLVSPTCDTCLRGAAGVHDALLAREPDSRLRPFVIWVPKLRGQASSIDTASARVPDPRILHFWDGGAQLMNAYQDVLGLPEDAWDVFLLYGPEARWDQPQPPRPRLWMHQLGAKDKPRVSGPFLDPEEFARQTRVLLSP